MIHFVTDGSARRNTGKAGWGAIIRQNKTFTVMRLYFQIATNSTMEWMAVTESLCFLPPGTVVWISSDSNCVRQRIKEWIHKWKPDIWKNLKNLGFENDALGRTGRICCSPTSSGIRVGIRG
jgi:ribonuclease HI